MLPNLAPAKTYTEINAVWLLLLNNSHIVSIIKYYITMKKELKKQIAKKGVLQNQTFWQLWSTSKGSSCSIYFNRLDSRVINPLSFMSFFYFSIVGRRENHKNLSYSMSEITNNWESLTCQCLKLYYFEPFYAFLIWKHELNIS